MLLTRTKTPSGSIGPTTTGGSSPTTGTRLPRTRMRSLKHGVSPTRYVEDAVSPCRRAHPAFSLPSPMVGFPPGLTVRETSRNGAPTRLGAGLNGAASRMGLPTRLPPPTGLAGGVRRAHGPSPPPAAHPPTPARSSAPSTCGTSPTCTLSSTISIMRIAIPARTPAPSHVRQFRPARPPSSAYSVLPRIPSL